VTGLYSRDRVGARSAELPIYVSQIVARFVQKEGVSQEKFYQLLDDSDEMARKNITQKSPKFNGILAAWEAVYTAKQQEAAVN
jgi:hypothetical protein